MQGIARVCILDVARRVISQDSKQRDNDKSTITRPEDAIIKYYTCCWLQGWWHCAYFFTLYCKERQWRTMVDCDIWVQDCAKQQPTNFYIAFQEQAMITKQQHCWRDDQVFTSQIVFQEATTTAIFLFVISQGATTTVDCGKHARLRQQQPSFLIDVDQAHQQSQGREAPAIILIATSRRLCQRCNHHFLTNCKEQWQ